MGVAGVLESNGHALGAVDHGLRNAGVLATVSVEGRAPAGIDARLAEVARLPFVTSVLGLPDRHQKGAMEVPSSIGIATRGVVVPEFTSVAVNDGMGVVVTDLQARDLSPPHPGAVRAHGSRGPDAFSSAIATA